MIIEDYYYTLRQSLTEIQSCKNVNEHGVIRMLNHLRSSMHMMISQSVLADWIDKQLYVLISIADLPVWENFKCWK